MMFMDLIKERSCRFKDYINEYDGQSLIVLGAGGGAKGIIAYLNDNHIREFRVCVDDDKWTPDMLVCGGGVPGRTY